MADETSGRRGPKKDADDITKSPEVLTEAAQKLREMADVRAATVRATQASKNDNYAVHLIPVDGENAEEAWKAAASFEAAQKAEEQIKAEAEQEDQRDYIYFMRCRTPIHTIGGRPAPPHGVYFTRRPDSVVSDEDWYSTYKPRTAAWRGQDVLCQACLKMNIEGPRLEYEWQDRHKGLWIPAKRWVWKQPRDVARYKIEGMTRAFDLPYESSNSWRAEHEKKLAKARQEGVLTNG